VSSQPAARTSSAADPDASANAEKAAVSQASTTAPGVESRTEQTAPKTALSVPETPVTQPSGAASQANPGEENARMIPPVFEPASPSPERDQPPVEEALPGSPLAWRSFTAIIVTCVGLPLAYWSRNLIPAGRARTPASLPAPGQQS